jgi:GT2 family glycosyltransferase
VVVKPGDAIAEIPNTKHQTLNTPLSVVIPSHRRADLLRLCLASVGRFAPPSTEVIVVDDGSPGAVVSQAAGEFAGVKVIRHAKARGFCAAANAGIAAATAPVVELLNDDAEVTAGWADAALAWFADERIAAVAPLVLQNDPERRAKGLPPLIDTAGDEYDLGGFARKRGHGQESGASHQETGRPVSRDPEGGAPPQHLGGAPPSPAQRGGSPRSGVGQQTSAARATNRSRLTSGLSPVSRLLSPGPVFGASACAAFYRREAVVRAGGFPEHFRAYFEDVDLSFRLRRLGFEIVYDPASVVWHRVSSSYGKRPSRRVLEQQSCNEERVFWRNVRGLDRVRWLPRHVAVLAAKALRRLQEGTLLPWLLGRVRAAFS